MKTQKMTFKKLSRDEMKTIKAGTSGGNGDCVSNDSCTYKCSKDGACSACCVAAELSA
jgi:hypothetical protein